MTVLAVVALAAHPNPFVPTVRVYRLDQPVVGVTKVVDGDTVDLAVEVDLGLVLGARYRPLDVDAPEIRTVLGPAARDATAAWLREHPSLRVKVWRFDSFGRRLCVIYDPITGEDLATHLHVLGLHVGAMLDGVGAAA